jgi:hypothetical protein
MTTIKSLPFLLWATTLITLIAGTATAQEQFLGHELCPCLMKIGELDPREIANLTTAGVANVTTYGIGCAVHDNEIGDCNTTNDNCAVEENILVTSDTPPSCDRTWCQRKWC